MSDFKWTNAAYHTMTASAINQLSVLYNMKGQVYNETFKREADNGRRVLAGDAPQSTGKLSSLETYITAFEQQGWTQRIERNDELIFDFTPAGEQAIRLLTVVPDYLKFLPYFVVEVMARYKQDNPAQGRRNAEETNIFPYWTFYKIIRECDNYLSEDEFRRFLVKIADRSKVDEVIEKIKSYRGDLSDEQSVQQLDETYGEALNDTKARPLYFMHRAGEAIGHLQNFEYGVLEKEGRCPLNTQIYNLNESYLPFIDHVIANEPPNLPNDLTQNDWFAYYGTSVKSHTDSIIDEDDPIWKDIEYLVNKGSSGIILSGPPGTSKTWYAKQIALRLTDGNENRIESIQFHPSYSYEDFVEGFVPNAHSGDGADFIPKRKVFAQMCDRALADPYNRYVLIIDEFNRGDISKILGELMTYIETDYRGIPFRLPYSEEELIVPRNLIVIGSMNPYDKSVTEFDIALTRRFDVYEMLPNEDLLKNILTKNGMDMNLQNQLVEFFTKIQEIFEVGLGHAFFKSCKDENDLKDVWKYQLKPLFSKEFKYEEEILQTITDLYPWSS